MLWVKSFHIVFVASWFAGLFYLPRIFVNLAMVDVAPSAERESVCLLMARKLLRFTHILSGAALAAGYVAVGWLRHWLGRRQCLDARQIGWWCCWYWPTNMCAPVC
jgi:putative membrane protein